MRKSVPFVLIVVTLIIYLKEKGFLSESTSNQPTVIMNSDEGTELIAEAFAKQRSDLLVQSEGKVIKLLADDLKGSRHQKFLLRLKNNHTLLIAHNIDLSPRIDSIKEGDSVAFAGEYEYNDKGGVVHWTHKDPDGDHKDGWLKHNGVTYE